MHQGFALVAAAFPAAGTVVVAHSELATPRVDSTVRAVQEVSA